MLSRILTIIGLLILGSGPAFAWNARGHEFVGEIADKLLQGTHAGAEVAATLGFSLRTAGTWADCVKSVYRDPDGTFHYRQTPGHPEYTAACTDFETPSEQARMESYVARNWVYCSIAPGRGCHETYHFADVAIQHDHYERAYAGTNDHDIVSAITAAIAVLKGQPAPAPFSIADKKEALFMLAHFIGDLHQPLHVGAVYLDPQGGLVDPDAGTLDPATETAGGNLINDGGTNLHTEWDAIPAALGTAPDQSVMTEAAAIATPAGAVETWPALWASDTVVFSHDAFANAAFSPTPNHHWAVSFGDHAAYVAQSDALKRKQLEKAGAHLAQLLMAVWP